MAVKTVRVRLGDAWTTLTYNNSTGRWEGQMTPPGTSIDQPGGYYSVRVEAENDSGEDASVSGAERDALRLVVRETVRPALTLVSPAQGYVTVKRPVIVMDAVDEAGGSGIDLESWTVLAPQEAAGKRTSQPIPGGYRLSWTPEADWADGPHVVTFSVSDRDGNTVSASAAYTVDTIPPELYLRLPDSHRVVDTAEITVAGSAYDANPVTVTVGGQTVTVTADAFQVDAPLTVGVNQLEAVSMDAAGLAVREPLTFIRLVTDRRPEDAERVLDMCRRGYARWTAAELEWWASTPCRYGSYDELDFNRVTAAMDWIAGWLEQYGYDTGYAPEAHSPWTEADALTKPQAKRYLENVEALRTVLPLPEGVPETPTDLEELTIQEANDIESILVSVDAMRPLLENAWWYCGEIYCGEV